jgi:hypothetical protein
MRPGNIQSHAPDNAPVIPTNQVFMENIEPSQDLQEPAEGEPYDTVDDPLQKEEVDDMCTYVLTSGPRKGSHCGKKTKTGNRCKNHNDK